MAVTTTLRNVVPPDVSVDPAAAESKFFNGKFVAGSGVTVALIAAAILAAIETGVSPATVE